MKIGVEDKKKLLIAAVMVPLALIAVVYLYISVFTTDTPKPATVATAEAHPATTTPITTPALTPATTSATPLRPAGAAAKQIATTSGQLDPTLHTEAMEASEALIYTGNGRNIFSANSMPVAMVKPIAPARPVRGPVVPAVYVPPPPPPIELKFFGTETMPNGERRAFLLHGEDVFIAAAGDIVNRRYRIGHILANSVEVEDMATNNKQMLPLMTN